MNTCGRRNRREEKGRRGDEHCFQPHSKYFICHHMRPLIKFYLACTPFPNLLNELEAIVLPLRQSMEMP